jgi:hypothetical protein
MATTTLTLSIEELRMLRSALLNYESHINDMYMREGITKEIRAALAAKETAVGALTDRVTDAKHDMLKA